MAKDQEPESSGATGRAIDGDAAAGPDPKAERREKRRQARVEKKARRAEAKAARAKADAKSASRAAGTANPAESGSGSATGGESDGLAGALTGGVADPESTPEALTLADRRFREAVPLPLQIAGSWAWRLIVIAAAVALIGWLVVRVSVITVPLGVALLLAAGLSPVAARLRQWGLPSALAAVLSLLGGIILVGGVLTLIVAQVVDQSGQLAQNAVAGLEQFTNWLSQVGISGDQVRQWQDQIVGWVTNWAQQSQAQIAQYSLQFGGAIGSFLAGAAMTLFAIFFLLHDGRSIWTFMLRVVPRAGRQHADRAGTAGWTSLVAYVKATVTVAAVDAVFPLITGLLMGMNLAWAMAGLIFMGAFVPIVGVVLTGAIAVLITLVTVGWVQALIMLGVIILVNQLEANVLQPMLLGRAVSLHPMAVLFAIAVGISIAGIIGGVLIIPVLAFTKSFVDALSEGSREALPVPRT